MRITALSLARLRSLAVVAVCSIACGALYGLVAGGGQAAVLAGAFIGGMIGASIAGFELFSADVSALQWLKRSPFLVNIVLRSAFYLAVFALAIQAGLFVAGIDAAGWGWTGADFLAAIAISLGVSMVISAVVRIAQLLGRGVLTRFLTGYYYRPREEERIFMFLDLVASSSTAERIGHLAFHGLLNEFIRDATEPILASRGEIHDYVGDEIIVTWRPKRGLRENRCIRCLSDIAQALERRRAAYRRAYGFVPRFRAALHIGPVVVGEMGVVKQTIVFLGDTVNTTARIEAACKELDVTVLVSEDLANRLENREGLGFEDIGPVTLRGKAEPTRLFRFRIPDQGPQETGG